MTTTHQPRDAGPVGGSGGSGKGSRSIFQRSVIGAWRVGMRSPSTFISGQPLCQMRAAALFSRRDFEACAKAFARNPTGIRI